MTDTAANDKEQMLLEYSNLTQSLLPRVNDHIQIELPTGERWVVIHLPSAEKVAEQKRVKDAKFSWEVRVMLALLCTIFGLMLVAMVFLPQHGPVVPGQHGRDLRAFSWGVFFLVLGGWTYWCKPPLRTPDGSAK